MNSISNVKKLPDYIMSQRQAAFEFFESLDSNTKCYILEVIFSEDADVIIDLMNKYSLKSLSEVKIIKEDMK